MRTLLLTVIYLISLNLICSAQDKVTIYAKPGCGRCEYAMEFMKENKIPFIQYNSADDARNDEMWNLVRNTGKYSNGESITMPVLVFKGNVYFSVDDLDALLSSFSGKPTKKEEVIQDVDEDIKGSSPIVYTMAGCGRCNFAREYLKENNIPFIEMSTSDDKINSQMFEAITKSGKYNGGSVKMPVIVHNSEVYFNIPDLESLLASIGGIKKVEDEDENDLEIIDEDEVEDDGDEVDEFEGQSGAKQIKGFDANEMLERHNYYRKQAGVAPLKWSDEIAKKAQKYAEILASKGCKLEHTNDMTYGENLYGASFLATAKDVVDSWGEEKQNFKYEAFTGNRDDGHYTQIIWQKTTQVGCGYAKCGQSIVCVCNYYPSGNYLGEYPYEK